MSDQSKSPPPDESPRAVIIGVVGFIIGFVVLEFALRGAGFVPHLFPGDRRYWAEQRERLESHSASQVALVGASIIRYGFSSEQFEVDYPGLESVQLAMDGKDGFGAAADILENTDFSGTLLVSLDPFRPFAKDETQFFYRYYQSTWNWNEKLSWMVFKPLALNFAMYNPENDGKDHLYSLLKWGGGIYPTGERKLDRTEKYFFDRIPVARGEVASMRSWYDAREKSVADAYVNMTERLTGHARRNVKWLMQYEDSFKRLQERGGKIVFTALAASSNPATVRYHEIFREIFWKEFEKQTSAAVVYFPEVLGTEGFETYDEFHVKPGDAPRFTKLLFQQLSARGLLPHS